jgi:hypothetical protein
MATMFSRTAFGCALASLAVLLSPDVRAQTGIGPLTKSDFNFYLESYDPGQKLWRQMSETEQAYFFNRARCECNGDTTNFSGYFRIAIEPAATTAAKIRALLDLNLVSNGSARFYAGGNVVNCLVSSAAIAGSYASYCVNLLDPGDPSAEVPGGMAAIATVRVWQSPPIPVAWLFNAANYPVCSGSACDATASCTAAAAKVTIYFWAETSSLGVPDNSDSFFEVNLVGQTVFAPDSVTADGGNEALTVRWSWPSGPSPAANASFLGVQIFCVRASDSQVFKSGTFAAAYMTSAATCPAVAPAPTESLAFANLDPSYLCSNLLPATTTSYRIPGLQNGISYGVGVAAVDKYGNLSPIAPADVVYASPTGAGGSDDRASFSEGCSCAAAGAGKRRSTLASLGWLGLDVLLLTRARMRLRGAGAAAGCSAARRTQGLAAQ